LKEKMKFSVSSNQHKMEAERELIPTRLSLLGRLKDVDNQESWKEFFDTYWKLIYATAGKSGLTDAEAQDVVQETIIAVVRNIPRFDAEAGSFKSWLLNLTRWRIVDQFRKRQPHVELGDPRSDTTRTSAIDNFPDPNGDWLKQVWNNEWERNVVNVAIERAKQQADPKQFQLFDLYVLKEWPIARIASALKISAARIYLAKHRVSRLIRKEAKALEKKYC
jgi:RNA polymerase sigma factor (sigma-70 family)